MSLGNCRYCGRKWIYVSRCNDCGDICCDKCATYGTQCRSCNSINRVPFEKNSEINKQVDSDDNDNYPQSNSSSSNPAIGFIILSLILCIWFFPIVLFFWLFTFIWFITFKMIGLGKWKPFDGGYFEGSFKIFVGVATAIIVGGLCSFIITPIGGVIVGLFIFFGGITQ